jgi:hypothetical protein
MVMASKALAHQRDWTLGDRVDARVPVPSTVARLNLPLVPVLVSSRYIVTVCGVSISRMPCVVVSDRMLK